MRGSAHRCINFTSKEVDPVFHQAAETASIAFSEIKVSSLIQLQTFESQTRAFFSNRPSHVPEASPRLPTRFLSVIVIVKYLFELLEREILLPALNSF